MTYRGKSRNRNKYRSESNGFGSRSQESKLFMQGWKSRVGVGSCNNLYK